MLNRNDRVDLTYSFGVISCGGTENQKQHNNLNQWYSKSDFYHDTNTFFPCFPQQVDAQDVHGFSPLHTAAACGLLPLTSMLLVFGADVFTLTAEHELPIDLAKDLDVARILSYEMTRLVHKELFIPALLRAQAEEAWLLCRKLLACVLLLVLKLCVMVSNGVQCYRHRHKKKDWSHISVISGDSNHTIIH